MYRSCAENIHRMHRHIHCLQVAAKKYHIDDILLEMCPSPMRTAESGTTTSPVESAEQDSRKTTKEHFKCSLLLLHSFRWKIAPSFF